MKVEFDFPRFEDLQLGPYGSTHGCGCLYAKASEIEDNSEMNGMESDEFFAYIRSALGGGIEEHRLASTSCPNTLKNRRKAYGALEYAIRKMGCSISS